MSTATLPDKTGHYGKFGGMFVPETLMTPLLDLEQAYLEAKADPAFQEELDDLLMNFCGRPTPLYFAERLTEKLGGAKIYFKREDLLHTGAHKINNAIGLKEAVNEAMRDWVATVEDTHYILGSALGAHPFPMMVRDFHRVIGLEAREQILAKEGRLPDLLIACVGGGSNAIGLFHPFLEDENVKMIGVEAGGDGIIPERHAARFQGGKLGVLQGTKTWLLANDDGQIELTHSVSAGLDYAAVGPEHAYLQDIGRTEYVYATDDEALRAFKEISSVEGILPALETSHGLAHVLKVAGSMSKDEILICNMSGRGDKDVEQAAKYLL